MTPGASTKKTLYEMLGVAPDASPEAIKAAYDLAAAAAGLDPGQRVALKEAASVLSNAQRRAVYDSSLRERESPPEIAVVEEDDEDAPARYGKKLWLVLGLVVALIAAWWIAKRPATKPRAVPAVSVASAVDVPASAPDAIAAASVSPDKLREGLLLGIWHCQGPLTGSGLNLNFVQDGTYTGTSNGEPVRGYYTLAQNSLTFNDGRLPNVFTVEELAAQGLVISRGVGKRLTCKR